MIQRSTGETIVCADTPRDPLSPVYLEPERPSVFKAVLADWGCLDDDGNLIPVPEYIPGRRDTYPHYRAQLCHLGWVLTLYGPVRIERFTPNISLHRQARKAKAALSNMLRFPWNSRKYKKWARVLDRYVTYMTAPRYPVKFDRLVSLKFTEAAQKAFHESTSYDMDIREIMCANPILGDQS